MVRKGEGGSEPGASSTDHESCGGAATCGIGYSERFPLPSPRV